jgi:hypothetical protein
MILFADWQGVFLAILEKIGGGGYAEKGQFAEKL